MQRYALRPSLRVTSKLLPSATSSPSRPRTARVPASHTMASTSSTEWPATPIPTETKELITKFFTLVDWVNPDAGPRLASEVFAEDGKLVSPGPTFEGSEGRF